MSAETAYYSKKLSRLRNAAEQIAQVCSRVSSFSSSLRLRLI